VRGRSFGDVAPRAVSADGRGERVCRLRVPGTNRHALRREVAVSRDATPEVRRLRRRREQIVHTFGVPGSTVSSGIVALRGDRDGVQWARASGLPGVLDAVVVERDDDVAIDGVWRSPAACVPSLAPSMVASPSSLSTNRSSRTRHANTPSQASRSRA